MDIAGTVRRLLTLFVLMTLAACGGGGGNGGGNVGGSNPPSPQMGGARQGVALNLSGVTSTLAGAEAGQDGIGAAADFNAPSSAVTVGDNLYVVDTYNHTIRQIEISTGVVTTLTGSLGQSGSADGNVSQARFHYPHGITTDGTNLYVADTLNYTIRKIEISTGEVTTLAGSPGQRGSTDGTGTAALFDYPEYIVADITSGNLYVSDTNSNTIRQIVISTSVVTTFAGAAHDANGVGTTARFSGPTKIVSDGTNLFVCDSDNHTIRKIEIATSAVTTLAGTANNPGHADGIGAAARFYSPMGITIDGTDLYVTDTFNNTIRKIVISTGEVTTIAGNAGSLGSTDGIGAVARFSYPRGITTDGTNLYITDTNNHNIRQIVIATAAVTTIAGTAGSIGSIDGTGATARFYNPQGITINGYSLFVADSSNNTIRQILISSGAVTTLVNSTAGLVRPTSITTDGTTLYVADITSIHKILIATSAVTTLAGTAGSTGSTDNTGTAARFYSPQGIAINGTNLYVADTTNNTIRRVVISTGEVTTFAGAPAIADGTGASANFAHPGQITTDSTNLYVADTWNNAIRQIVINTGVVTTLAGGGLYGSTDGTGAGAQFFFPRGITTDGSNLYVADTSNHSIRQIVISTGVVTTLAGGVIFGSNDGVGVAAGFRYPQSITTNGTDLFLTDADDNTIRKITISTGVVTTLAGAPSGADNTGKAARFFTPESITTDGTNLYVADTANHTIRKIVISTGKVTTLAGKAGSWGSSNGTGAAARFDRPSGITTDGTNLYVTDTSNQTIRKIVITSGEVTTLAGTEDSEGTTDGTGTAAQFSSPIGITTDNTNLYVADVSNNTIRQIVISTGEVTTLAGTAGFSGSGDGNGAVALFNRPRGITTDGTNLYVTDSSNNTIRKIVISTGAVTTLAGAANSMGYIDGTGVTAEFSYPNGITTDGTNIYVSDANNYTIRKIVISTGVVTTLAGTAGSSGSLNGTGAAAQFNNPRGITTDGSRLFIADMGNDLIRVIR